MDKTSATRAADFRHVCRAIANLCKSAEMKDTQLIAELKPSATMTDRANAERAACRLITESERVNPTCGEHGALVNPLGACTKAMDGTCRGWMGKSEEAAKLAGLSAEDRLVFQEVERASTAGISTKDLKSRASLQTPQLTRVLKKLEARKLVQHVK